METDFDRVGGEPGLRKIIEDFTARVFEDVMIGFLFAKAPRRRLVELEYRFAAVHLGADVVYTGRSMRDAHAAAPILGGHFQRRRKLLADTLRDHLVPEDVAARWLGEVDARRDEVLGVGADPVACDHTAAAARASLPPEGA